MSDAEDLSPSDQTPVIDRAPVADPPRIAYQAALGRYEGFRLVEIYGALGLADPPPRPQALAGAIAERLGEPRVAERALAGLGMGPRMALSLFGLTESASWPASGLSHALACLGVDPVPAVRSLVERGLLAVWPGADGPPVSDFGRALAEAEPDLVELRAHPSAMASARTVLPEAGRPAVAGPVRQVREADGLEPIVRLAAVWQRVDEAPLRQTQQGVLYKRDRDRLEDDPVLAGPIADALEPLPDMAALWIALARGVGLLEAEPEGDRIVAVRPDFWAENAFHLPQMIATRWLALRTWHEQGGMQQDGATVELALPFVRPAILLWLATRGEDEWVALDDLAAHLRGLAPDWGRATFREPSAIPAPPRARSSRGKVESRTPPNGPDTAPLEALLLGAAYQLGLIRVAEDVSGGRRVVQLSGLGRYILALGPPPSPRPTFEHFLFVQPNFEIIAYRQGLTPALIGQFSRFARWSQVGAALELKLTPDSVYRGLEGGLTTQAMLDRLARHSSRPLPASVAEALRTWAGRRDRVTYYSSATLIEFATRAELERALEQWPATGRVAPVPISDRLLLVEDESSIPFQRFRLAGSRDYRRAPAACLEIEPDGVTLALDLGRSDLLIDAELARFADELPLEPASGMPGKPLRRFRISSASLARAIEDGLSLADLSHWFVKRTGAEIPPAIRLLFLASSSRVPPLATRRPIVLDAPSSELLDGLIQHPDTRAHLGERLGPTTVIVPDEALAPLRRALEGLGLSLADPDAPEPGDGPGRHRKPGQTLRSRRGSGSSP